MTTAEAGELPGRLIGCGKRRDRLEHRGYPLGRLRRGLVKVRRGTFPSPGGTDFDHPARRRSQRARGVIGSAPRWGRTVAVVTLDELAARLREFAAAREWEQFHTPKNLAMALAGEVGELVAELQWLTPEEAAQVMADPEAAARIRSELADVTIYLVRLADLLDVDLIEAARAKLAQSECRY